ncbi:hypothetical protein IC617_17500 [Neiella sp. HB171785]|uniref:SGNH hydrolase-type esterase domain-containing protein n=1 Tax=Neiella litorisoli TaxID=2771431 RepID=A0A8J6R470_9GAMM|nr:SGNH/GDSL hydrolase family protein [Neiella litorisoli]MBD1391225.1 hypothetical protein [Neiella litorisoli]
MNPLIINADHSALHYCGRFDHSVAGQASHSWPYTGIRVQLQAEQVRLLLTQEQGIAPVPSYYDVFINDRWLRTICCQPSQNQYLLCDGDDNLPQEGFELGLYRRTESLTGVSHFVGLELFRSDAAPTASPATPRPRKIEFYGDSISCGYGNESAAAGYQPAHSNACKAFPALVAKQLNADASVVAYSGEGIYRRFDGNEKFSLPNFYQQCHFYSDARWELASWAADAVVINLGTNDFVAGMADQDKFVTAYSNFIHDLANHYPATPIFVVLAPNQMVADCLQQATYLKQVVNNGKTLGIPCHYVEVATLADGLSGSDNHPNLEQHQYIADHLSTAITETLGC